MNRNQYASIDAYINAFPEATQKILREVRAVIHAAAPDAEERISYQMPAFYLKGNLVYFAAYPKHIGFYPTSSGIEKFKEKLSAYKFSKGAVQFPIDQPMPLDLIREMVLFRVRENLEKAARPSA